MSQESQKKKQIFPQNGLEVWFLQHLQQLAATRQDNMAQKVLNNYLDEVTEYYNKPVET